MPVRGALFVVLTLWMWLGPAYRQVLESDNPYVNRWVMFSGVGLGLVEVRYERALPSGARERVDHYRMLGYASAEAAPSGVRRIMDRTQAQRVGRMLCQRLGADARVYLKARQAVREGWSVVDDGRADLCRSAQAERAQEPAAR